MKKKKVEKRAGNEEAASFCALDKQRSHYTHGVEGPSACRLRPPLCSMFWLSLHKCLMPPPPAPDVFTETIFHLCLCWIRLPLSFVAEDLLTFLRHSRLHCLVDNVLAWAKCAVPVGGCLQNALGMGSSYSTGAVEAGNLHSSFQSLLGINHLAVGKDSGPILVKHRQVDPEFDLSTGLGLRAIKVSVHSHLKQSNHSH